MGFGDAASKTLAYGAGRTDTPQVQLKRRGWAELAVPGVRQGDLAGIQGHGRLSGGPGTLTLLVDVIDLISTWGTGVGVSPQMQGGKEHALPTGTGS